MGILSGVNNFFFDVVKFFNKPGPTKTFDIALSRSRVKQNVKTAELLGVTDVTMHESSVLFALTGLANNVLTETLDTTTYSDKAILRLYNGTGNDRYLTTLQLDGKRIMRYSGSGGGLVFDGLKKDDDIRRNGLQEMEISNNYLVTAAQVEKVGDYWWKAAGKKKHLFALTIPGFAWWYSPGDWYNFAVGTAGTAEYIDAVVECYSVDVEKTAGSIGSTNIMFREVEENWAKTTLYTARLLASGSPKRRVNRSNTVTVASATYSGTYDYRCDGVDDDVQIQAAIDYVYTNFGGGEVILPHGQYRASATITMKNSVKLIGYGSSTVILPTDNTVTTIIDFGTATNASIENFTIDGDGDNITFTTDGMMVVDGQNLGKSVLVSIKGYAFSCTTGQKYYYGFYEIFASICSVLDNTINTTGTKGIIVGFENCKASQCSVSNNNTTGNYSDIKGFNGCTNLSSCSVYGNASSGNYSEIAGFSFIVNISSCSVYDNSSTGNSTGLYGFAACNNVTACKAYNNTASGTSSIIYGYASCVRISVSSTQANASVLSDEHGFSNCNSVQQCKSDGDSIPYGTGVSQSYSDAARTAGYECADTPNGGFNS